MLQCIFPLGQKVWLLSYLPGKVDPYVKTQNGKTGGKVIKS